MLNMRIIPVPQVFLVDNSDIFPSMDHVIISITETSQYLPQFKDNQYRKDILRVQFHDVGTKCEGLSHFRRYHAKQIVDFVNQYRDISKIIIHCTAGLSRSPAVAAALTRGMYGEDDSVYFDQCMPNKLVYRTLLEYIQRGER